MKTNLVLLLVLLSFTIFSQEKMRVEHAAAGDLTFNIVYTGIFTGYDLQSNGTPQQVWQDPNNPELVHAVFIHSFETSGWADRNGKYLLSSDTGQSWNDMGNVQVGITARGGYPSISGLSDGRPVVGLHTSDSIEGSTRTQIYVRNSSGTTWTRYDPGSAAGGEAIWTRVLGVGNDRVVFTSSVQEAPDYDFVTNSLNLTTGQFSGWNSIIGEQAESYCIEKSEDEHVIGLAYAGNRADSATFGNVYYRESHDGGITWNEPSKIFQYDFLLDSLGVFRGIDIIFLDDTPYVVFEIVKQDFTSSAYYPTEPNKILLWSPALNNGESFPLAQSGLNVPFYIVYGANQSFVPVCRPTIGRSAEGNALFVVMSVVTDRRYVWSPDDSTSYFAGYITYSTDAGNNWTTPLKFTPESPVKDYRYFSISPTNSVSSDNCKFQLTALGDTIPGRRPFIPYPNPITAEFVGITGTVSIISAVKDQENIPYQFNLSRNFPNPFNPSTTIYYSIPSASEVNISVYNLLGEKIKEAVNEFKQPGSYEVKLNMEAHNSGVYFYKMQSGSFVEIKKMILIK